jgi:hypothetical protein
MGIAILGNGRIIKSMGKGSTCGLTATNIRASTRTEIGKA